MVGRSGALASTGRTRVLSGLIGLLSLVLVLGASTDPAAAGFGGLSGRSLHHRSPSSPSTFDANSDIGDIIHDLLGTLTNSMEVIGFRNGSLTGSERITVAFDLADAEVLIDEALDSIPGGSIDSSVNPQTLSAYSIDCVVLAAEASAEFGSGSDFDHQDVAAKLKTIRNLITRSSPHNYRTKAGI